jgi:hypothetical protein
MTTQVDSDLIGREATGLADVYQDKDAAGLLILLLAAESCAAKLAADHEEVSWLEGSIQSIIDDTIGSLGLTE